MLRNNFDFSLTVNGGSVKEYEHQGQVFIEGKKGTEFSIRVKNNTHKQCLAVLTVDGKSIINGEAGDLDTGGGYIISAYSSVTIPGWRLDNDAIAKFVFSDPGESYVAKSDDNAEAMNNIGVIGCAMFHEKQNFYGIYNTLSTRSGPSVPYQPPIWYGQTGSTSGSKSKAVLDDIDMSFQSDVSYTNNNAIPCSATLDSNAPASLNHTSVCNLGTGFGEASNHSVSIQSFDRCIEPEAVFTLYYDTRNGLEARGVNFKAAAYISPSPFPASKGRGCTPPADWNGKSCRTTKLNPDIEAIKKRKTNEKTRKTLAKQIRELERLKEEEGATVDENVLKVMKTNMENLSRYRDKFSG